MPVVGNDIEYDHVFDQPYPRGQVHHNGGWIASDHMPFLKNTYDAMAAEKSNANERWKVTKQAGYAASESLATRKQYTRLVLSPSIVLDSYHLLISKGSS